MLHTTMSHSFLAELIRDTWPWWRAPIVATNPIVEFLDCFLLNDFWYSPIVVVTCIYWCFKDVNLIFYLVYGYKIRTFALRL